MERQEVRRVLLELASRAKHLARWPQAIKAEDIKELADYLNMVEYFSIVERKPVVIAKSQNVPEYLRCVECQALGIASSLPLWNLGGRWLCLRHIPPDVTFPIGLWGDDWLATGRAPSGAGGQKRVVAGTAVRPESWTPPELPKAEPKPSGDD